MSFERKDWEKLREKKRRPSASTLNAMAREAVMAEHLTGSPHWDQFLSYIQAAMREAEEAKKAALDVLQNPTVVRPEDMMLAKQDVMLWEERRRVFEAVLSLPKDLMELGEKAKPVLERLGDDAA